MKHKHPAGFALVLLVLFSFLFTGCGAFYMPDPIILTDHTNDAPKRTIPDDPVDPSSKLSASPDSAEPPVSEDPAVDSDSGSFDIVSSDPVSADCEESSDAVLPPADDPPSEPPQTRELPITGSYILNLSSKKIHRPDCGTAATISADNKAYSNLSVAELMKKGYTPCGNCMKEYRQESGSEGDGGQVIDRHTSMEKVYVLNLSTKKIHLADCSSAKKIKTENYAETTDPDAYISKGYAACKICKPFG